MLPLILGVGGYWLLGIEIQENLSLYYHTPLRDIFVGIMFSIGLFLFCYIGSSPWENWTGNLACVAAIGIALFPIDPHADPLHQVTVAGWMHTMFGGVFFTCITIFSVHHFPHNEPEDDSKEWLLSRVQIFRLSGAVLVGSVTVMGLYLFGLDREARQSMSDWNVIFWGEWVAIWAFAIAWLVKGRTLLMMLDGLAAAQSLRSRIRD